VGRVEKQPKTLENAESASWQGKIHRKIAFIWGKLFVQAGCDTLRHNERRDGANTVIFLTTY
jgi:hypothetical protein